MSKEKQIEEMITDISEMQNGGWEFVGDSEYTTDVSNEALAEHLYNAGYRKQSEWISVEERLPERQGMYLGCTYKGVIMFAPFSCFYATNDKPQFCYDITHWMPLPEPPKKGGAE